jgi:hypothetical protein
MIPFLYVFFLCLIAAFVAINLIAFILALFGCGEKEVEEQRVRRLRL